MHLLFYLVELLNKDVMNRKPFVCLGEMWKYMVDTMEERVKAEGRTEGLIKNFAEPDEIVKYVTDSLS